MCERSGSGLARGFIIALGIHGLACLCATSGQALPGYEIVTVGLTDAEHTNGDRFAQESIPRLVSQSGYVVGSSIRYAGRNIEGYSAWLFDGFTTTRIGLFDLEHTDTVGDHRYTSASHLTESGLAAGISYRYDGSVRIGQSAWLYDGSTTIRLGYVDADHKRSSDGRQYSSVDFVNESGWVVGQSERYSGALATGYAAWLYDGGTTTRLGYLDPEHTSSTGVQSTSLARLTDSGLLIGHSRRYVGAADGGKSAWLYDGIVTTRLGYFDDEHTRSTDGYQISSALRVTESGFVAGGSARYIDGTPAGSTAWLYDGTSTTPLGLFDADHTDEATGYGQSSVSELSESGFVAGTSLRFTGSAYPGRSAWISDGTSTTRIGLFDGEHTSANGDQDTYPIFLSDTGRVVGSSHRYAGNEERGNSAWLYDGANSIRLGLTDAAHTTSDGRQASAARQLTESGYVIGISIRASGPSFVGQSAWLYDGAATTRLGLFDPDHVRSSDGHQMTSVDLLTESGFAAGYSERYVGPGYAGRTSWIFDASTNEQISLVFDVSESGFAFSHVSFLGEDGLALGSYHALDADGAFLVLRGFAWTPEAGVLELGSLVDGSLSAAGWSVLSSAIGTNAFDQIVGSGVVANGGVLAFVLTPIPEPGTGLSTAVGFVILATCRRRRFARIHDRSARARSNRASHEPATVRG